MMTMEKKDDCATEVLNNQQTAYSPEKIAELTKRVLGSQSIVQYAQKSGVSKSWLSKALNAKLPGAPTRRILTRLWENSDDPTIQLSELLRAAGLKSDKSDAELIVPESLVATYLAGNTLNPLNIFMNATRLGDQTSFVLQYERHRFVVEINGGKKRYVCFPALCHGMKDASKVVIAETMLNLMDKKAEDIAKADCTTTYVLTDEPEMAKYFKLLSENLTEPIQVLLTEDYVTVCNC